MANSARLGLTASLCQDLLPGGCVRRAITQASDVMLFKELIAKDQTPPPAVL